jgi:hypothetical protein
MVLTKLNCWTLHKTKINWPEEKTVTQDSDLNLT